MPRRFSRLGFRRQLQESQKQVEGLGSQAERGIEQHLMKRFGRLLPVRRFVIGWVGLFVLLIAGLIGQNFMLSKYYQTLRPVPGGIYNEGVLGNFTNANPIYASGNADSTVSKLIFSGLLTSDNHNHLTGDLASGYTVDSFGTTYTVHMRHNLHWQDGAPLTSADVAFTYKLIQNPDAQSPLQTGWQGITITAPDPYTVTFKLPSPLASFAYNLTNGIVPQHLLASVPPADLRSADFNTVHPVGAGPFKWQAIQVTNGNLANAQEQIALVPFDGYARGKPKLQEFIVHAYASAATLANDFASGRLSAAEGLNDLPAKLQRNHSEQVYNIPLNASNMVFFKTSSGILADQAVRQSLVHAADVPSIIKRLDYPSHAVREPLLAGQLGYDPSLAQANFDLKAAQKLLDDDGWKAGADGLRSKDGKQLIFSLASADTPEYRMVTSQLKDQWQKLGVKLQIRLQKPSDFQNTLAYHDYDALLYGISIGADPDVFVYWDSSQADVRSANRLNFSEYKSSVADTALEAGRTRLNPEIRAVKYKPFLQAWQQDAPALGLYQARLLYVSHVPIDGLTTNAINTPTDRLDNVHNWQIRQARVTN